MSDRRVRITEVGPRDGLQNEAAIIDARDKIAFIDLLSVSGVAEIEVSSFVSPTWVPQLADAEAVVAGFERHADVISTALVPNLRGMERAMAAGVDRVALFTAASETFSHRNTNASIDAMLDGFVEIVRLARGAGIGVGGYISCVVACPYEGATDPARVRAVAERLLGMGVETITLGETIGVAVPSDIDRLFEALRGVVDPENSSLHLHDTRGTALACALRGLQLGVRRFDGSCGGLGGCPYAPGAAGNLATEDLVYLCEGMGYDTGVSIERLVEAASFIEKALGRALSGRVYRACRS